MLVTLLLCNAMVLEILPLYLSRAVSEFVTMIVAVLGVLMFGEVIPQSLCTGPSKITIAVWLCPIVRLLMYATAPFSWPIAKLLDCCLDHSTYVRYTRSDLQEIIALHSEDQLKKVHAHLPKDTVSLRETQVNLMTSALNDKSKNISPLLTPLE